MNSRREAQSAECRCAAIKRGVQTFRIGKPAIDFEYLQQLPGIPEQWISARAVWACRHCGQFFAWMRIPYKDEEEIIVRTDSNDPQSWDWASLARIADECRWRGPSLDLCRVL